MEYFFFNPQVIFGFYPFSGFLETPARPRAHLQTAEGPLRRRDRAAQDGGPGEAPKERVAGARHKAVVVKTVLGSHFGW